MPCSPEPPQFVEPHPGVLQPLSGPPTVVECTRTFLVMKKYLVVSRLSQENCLPGLQSKAEWLERPRDGETEKKDLFLSLNKEENSGLGYSQ